MAEPAVHIPTAACVQCHAPAPLLELLETQYGMRVPIDLRKRLLCNQCRALNKRVTDILRPPQTIMQMERT